MAENKKLAVVTGGAGFIGSHLCKRLLKEGFKVISLDNYFTGSPDNHIEGVEYRKGHTKNASTHISEYPDRIYHLGEYSRVEVSFEEPSVVWDLNISGTLGVLEFWRNHPSKLIYAGSSTKFADGGMGRDQSPYAWTKATNTELVNNYGAWYGLPYAITYFYNVYGPGERSGRYGSVVEIFKQKFLKGEPLGVVTPGTQKRNFTHVEDIIEGLMAVGEKGEGDNFGLGNGSTYSVLDLANMFGGPIEMLPERPGNRMSASIDTTKTEALGWKAKRKLEDYVKEALS